MLSFKRLLYIVLIVAVLGGVFVIYSINESRPTGVQIQSRMDTKRDFIETRQINEGEKPRAWILGDPGDGLYGEIYSNVRQLCEDLHLTVAGEGQLDMGAVDEMDLLIFCSAYISRYADPTALESFISGGGRVILAAGLEEEDSRLRTMLGIREISAGEDYHEIVFEKPLLPVQPESAYYDGNSGSGLIEVSSDATVYLRDEESGVPLLYTYEWNKGGVCLINGTFLSDIRCMGFLTGAISALQPDFVYPILGVKAVFLDNFPMAADIDDELCRRLYGYSAEGFIKDVVWPAFQGISLRTDTPYTAGILAAASSEADFGTVSDALLAAVGKSVLQFGGELVYAADCPETGKLVINKNLIERFAEIFPGYSFQGLVLESDMLSPEIPDIPDAAIRSVRGRLGSHDARLSWEDDRAIFPAATFGNSIEDGALLSIYSVLGAYGMVSHVFDAGALIGMDGDTAAWDLDRRQIGIFETEVLARVPWLEGRTLTQTGDDVRSYQNLEYGWTKSSGQLEFDCSGAAKGQAFFYHTDDRITGAEGMTYEDLGNGYYLLRVQESHCVITLEEEK